MTPILLIVSNTQTSYVITEIYSVIKKNDLELVA
jgi:hypothetical protein